MFPITSDADHRKLPAYRGSQVSFLVSRIEGRIARIREGVTVTSMYWIRIGTSA